eukprot:INCI5755.1.p1 GENE.INCI5755.1~~INCI5755.1.p1  ORF type:complete len:193 (-),score=36.24 INCI5755.1:118-696(-)
MKTFALLAGLVGFAAAREARIIDSKPTDSKPVDAPELQGIITVSRTVNTLTGATGKVTLDKDCTSSDSYGSNDCSIHFGDTLTIDYDLELTDDIEQGATIEIDAKLDNVVPFKASCLACGADCTVTVPVIKKTFDIKMPDCPIAAGAFKNTTTVTLPATSPIPLALSVKGKVTVKDASGTTKFDLDVDAALK